MNSNHQTKEKDNVLGALLEREQEELLARLVRAVRLMPRNRRRAFYVNRLPGGRQAHLSYPGAVEEITTNLMDLEVLIASGLLHARPTGCGSLLIDVSPQGFHYQKQHGGPAKRPVQTVDDDIQNYLNAFQFRHRYAEAHRKWRAVEAVLSLGRSEREIKTIRRLCGEILDAFSRQLAIAHPPAAEVPAEESGLKRLQAVLEAHGEGLSAAKRLFLAALLGHWYCVDASIDGRLNPAESRQAPTWYDGRRLVFLTATIMYVVDEALVE